MNIGEGQAIIIAALISVIGVLFTVIYTEKTRKKIEKENISYKKEMEEKIYVLDKKKIYNNFITDSRMGWLEEFRDCFSKAYGIILENLGRNKFLDEQAIHINITKLRLLLNPKVIAETEKYIFDGLKKIDDKFYSYTEIIDDRKKMKQIKQLEKEIREELEEVLKHVTILLKIEWENIKDEIE